MTRPMIRIIDCQTNEVIDRQMTTAEYAVYQEKLAKESQKLREIEEKQNAKNALLEKLGITEDEAKLLLL